MNETSETARKNFTRTAVRLLLHLFVYPLCTILFALTATLFLYFTFRPELLAQEVQNQLTAATGLPWRINGSILPMFSPSPGITATDVLLLAASEEQGKLCNLDRPLVEASKVHIALDTRTLLEFRPRIRLLSLESPGIHLTYDAMKRPLWLPLSTDSYAESGADSPASDAEQGFAAAPLPTAGSGASANADASGLPQKESGLQPAARSLARAESLRIFSDILLKLSGSAFPPMHISRGSFYSFTVTGEHLLSFKNIEADFNPHLPAGNFKATADFDLPDAGLKVRLSLEGTTGREGIPARGSIEGEIAMTPPKSRTLNGSFAGNFTWKPGGRDLVLPDFRFVAEGDGLMANLHADLAKGDCTGLVQLHKLSLPRWFGFGRSLPPGLQQPMDGFIGEFDLFLDAHGAEAWNLRGAVGPLAVSGYVGVKDFSAPEVVVDLDLGKANLDLIFPFLAKAGKFVPDPRQPDFDHPVLAPFPKDPTAAPAPDARHTEVSYDVKVRVASPRVHDVDAGPLEVLVFPVRIQGEQKTRVAFDKIKVLAGLISGELDIDDAAITMRYDVAGAELGLLPENADNAVRIAGKVTGRCEMELPINAEGNIEDTWKLSVNAAISNCDITGSYAGGKWQLFSGTARANGKGSIYSVLSKGIRIEGLWDVAAQSVKTSWNPKGKDGVSGQFNGALIWPPIERKPRRFRRERLTVERTGLDRIAGSLALNGSFAAPLGNVVVPVRGKLNSRLSWLVEGQKINLDDIKFEGLGGYAEGAMHINFSGNDVLVNTEVSSKMNPRVLLKEWGLLPPAGIMMPKVMTGKASIASSKEGVRFDKLRLEADGAPLAGEISWKPSPVSAGHASGQWTFLLMAEHLNLDNFFPESKSGSNAMPSQDPWDLKAFRNASLDARLTLRKAKYRQFTFSNAKVTGTLQRDRFSLHTEIGNFYDGAVTLLFQGTIVPSASQVSLRKGLLQMQNVSLGKALYDYTKQQFYAGTAELVVDIAGNLTCNADIPRKLSGIWSLQIKDGLYPAFLTTEKSNLRNTFSHAGASGAITRGVISSNNFKLSGPMVDMTGSGTLNLATSEIDLGVSVTFAKVPTVPVRFTGTTDKPKMQVQGVNMVVETVQAAGVGVFSLVKNVLELPAHAIRGINSLVTKEK